MVFILTANGGVAVRAERESTHQIERRVRQVIGDPRQMHLARLGRVRLTAFRMHQSRGLLVPAQMSRRITAGEIVHAGKRSRPSCSMGRSFRSGGVDGGTPSTTGGT